MHIENKEIDNIEFMRRRLSYIKNISESKKNIPISYILARFKQLHDISLSYRKMNTSYNEKMNIKIRRIMKEADIYQKYSIEYLTIEDLHEDDFILFHYYIDDWNHDDINLLYYNFIQILKMFSLYNINITDAGNNIIDELDLDKTLNSTDNKDFFNSLFRHRCYFLYKQSFKVFLKQYTKNILYLNIGLEYPFDFYFIIYYDKNNKLNLGFFEYRIGRYGNNLNILNFKNTIEYKNIFYKAYNFQKEYTFKSLYRMYQLTKLKDKVLNVPYKLGIVKNPLYNKNQIFNNSIYLVKELP